MMSSFWDQYAFDGRFEWGVAGAKRMAGSADVLVIVDVLSFTTCIDVAVARGATVFPYRWRDASAEEFARNVGATLAVGRDQVSPEHPFSLAPGTLRATSSGDRIVLPSPNGSTVTTVATEGSEVVLAGCLRNARAVADAARELGATMTVIASGERWHDEPAALRPSFEDLVGAGAILDAYAPSDPSPETVAAMAAFNAVAADLPGYLRRCSSGRELIERGYGEDVEIAAELNASSSVPILKDGAYVALG